MNVSLSHHLHLFIRNRKHYNSSELEITIVVTKTSHWEKAAIFTKLIVLTLYPQQGATPTEALKVLTHLLPIDTVDTVNRYFIFPLEMKVSRASKTCAAVI